MRQLAALGSVDGLLVTLLMPGCPQALMDQKFVFLQILGSVSRFDIDGEGNLVLHGKDGRTLMGHRK